MMEFLELPPLTHDDIIVIFFLIVAMVFGIIVIAAVVVLARSSREKRKCPFCAESVQPDAKLCRHCGHELPASEVNTAKASDASAQLEP